MLHLKSDPGFEVVGTALNGPRAVELVRKLRPDVLTLDVDMPGWKQPLRACRSFAEMPEAARRVVELVEQHIGIPVSIVGVGPERDDCVLRA